MMKNKNLLIFGVFVFVMAVGLSSLSAQKRKEHVGINTNTYKTPPQGTIIPCELCVVLYPEHYEKDPKKCPVCHGAKEHFQPAQMMTRKMAQIQLHELDVEIQDFLYKTVLDSLAKPVKLHNLKRLRKLYRSKLIHLLVYDFIEVAPLKEKIRQ